jgi:hypothetical protein
VAGDEVPAALCVTEVSDARIVVAALGVEYGQRGAERQQRCSADDVDRDLASEAARGVPVQHCDQAGQPE